jgi:hypothetical protein
MTQPTELDVLDLQRQARLTAEAAEFQDAMQQAMQHDCAYAATGAWGALVSCDEQSRVGHIAARYFELARTPAEQPRKEVVDALIRAELELDEPTLRAFTLSRLRSWILMAVTAPEAARTISDTYEAVFASLPGAMEFRRATTVQAVFQTGISPSGQHLLLDLVPGMRRFTAERRPAAANVAPTTPSESRWKRIFRRTRKVAPDSA